MLRVNKVTDKIFRGRRPNSFSELEEHRVKYVITLQSGTEDFFTDTEYEAQVAQAYGMQRIRIPCSNWLPPSRKSLERVLEIIKLGRTTYIHCHSGVDRTGCAILFYRMKVEGWSFDQAHREWKEMGRHWWFFWWTPYMAWISTR